MAKGTNPRRSNGTARTRIRQRLIAQAAGRPVCAACGQPIDLALPWPHPLSFSIDEIVPVSKGGSPFRIDNCRPMHLHCNCSRGNRPLTRATRATGRQAIPLSQAW